MALTKEQMIKLRNIFDNNFDWQDSDGKFIYYPSLVKIVDEFIESQNDINKKQEENSDQYLDRLVKDASSSWAGIDPTDFLDYIRGHSMILEWNEGPPNVNGDYLVLMRGGQYEIRFVVVYDGYTNERPAREILCHLGPIPKVPQNIKDLFKMYNNENESIHSRRKHI